MTPKITDLMSDIVNRKRSEPLILGDTNWGKRKFLISKLTEIGKIISCYFTDKIGIKIYILEENFIIF